MKTLLAIGAVLLQGTAPAAEKLYPGYAWQDLGRGIYLHGQSDPLAAPVDGNTTVLFEYGIGGDASLRSCPGSVRQVTESDRDFVIRQAAANLACQLAKH